METDSSLIAGISFFILVSDEIWMLHEVTKIIHRFCSFKGTFQSVNITFILTVFYYLPYIIVREWLRCFNEKNTNSSRLPMLCDRDFGFPQLQKKPT